MHALGSKKRVDLDFAGGETARLTVGAFLLLALCLPASRAIGEDNRSLELLSLQCRSERNERAVTLFANGTVRLVESGEQRDKSATMKLYELPAEELESYRRRLAESPHRTLLDDDRHDAPEGEFTQICDLVVDRGGGEKRRVRFSRFGGLSLDTAYLVAIADELADLAGRAVSAGGFPTPYEPQPGDLLRRADGKRFRVVRFTGDRSGVELHGVEEPLVLYLRAEDIRATFAELVERRDAR